MQNETGLEFNFCANLTETKSPNKEKEKERWKTMEQFEQFEVKLQERILGRKSGDGR